jgi:hypothetical protein
MVNPTHPDRSRENKRTNSSEAFSGFDTSSHSRKQRSLISERSPIDEIIVSLSDAYENRRARQVVEWVRQQSVRRAA